MYRAILEQVLLTVESMGNRQNVQEMGAGEIENLAKGYGRVTELGNTNFVSTVKNLCAAQTVYIDSNGINGQSATQKKRDIAKSIPQTIRSLQNYLEMAPLVGMEAAMGEGTDFTPLCRLYVSTYRPDSIHLAWMASQTLFPVTDQAQQCWKGKTPLTVIVIPEWQEKDRQVLVFPEIGVTFILGSDYFGEIKNAFLRMAMWHARRAGMLGLHAGSKTIVARGEDGNIRKLGMIMFGIAATGKTTHACHDHDLSKEGECVEIVQDDVVFWGTDGSASGSERGFYIKTEGLSHESQPQLYNAALSPNAILENVMVDYQGKIYLDDRTLTPNGHAIIMRNDLGKEAAPSINLPPIKDLDRLVVAFMVRNYTAVPIVSKLTAEQAAVAFMLSESLDAAGADQQKGDITSRGISSSPFIIGDASEEVNRFYEMLKSHGDRIEAYMLNTGGAGELIEHSLDGVRKVRKKVTRVSISEMGAIIRGIGRGSIKWREDANWMVETPVEVDGLDISNFDLTKHYDQHKIDSLIAAIRQERSQYASQYKNLLPEIRRAVEF